VYPKPFLDRIEPSARDIVQQLNRCSVEPTTVNEVVRRAMPVPDVCAGGVPLELAGTD
jgi:hypothetical protein